MRVALKGRAARQRLPVSGPGPAHEILTGECPFQELARSEEEEQEGHINISHCNLLLDKLSHVIG